MRAKIARCLRKWADLIDPCTRPSMDGLTVRVNCDNSQFIKGIDEVQSKVELLWDAMDRMWPKDAPRP